MDPELAHRGNQQSVLEADVLDAVPVALLRVTAQGEVRSLNRAAFALLGTGDAVRPGMPLVAMYRLVDPQTGASVPQRAAELGQRRELRLVRLDGAELEVAERWLALDDGDAWLVLEDITELRALRREQQWLSFHDPVTSLPNRRSLERSLEAALTETKRGGAPIAFGYLDLDDFEAVVDTFGQVAGDELVRQVAEVIRGHLRPNDKLARISETRFGLLLRDCPTSRVAERTETLRRAVAAHRFVWQDETFTLGATAGMVPERGERDLLGVLSAADAASSVARDESMAHAFDAEDSIEVSLAHRFEDMRWLSRIHLALKHGRFRLFRQPIVPIAAPAETPVALYEVLLRMVDQAGRLVSPGLFIPAAERFHLIASLDRWVMRSVFARLAEEHSATFAVTVNVSGASLSESRFLDDVLEALETTGAPGHRVCFEITETAVVGHLPRARRFLGELRGRGCRFVLDDFGSGLSSFAYLEELSVDFIKIDGRFVTGVADDPVRRAIVSAIRQVAQAVGVRTIGEFVEDAHTRTVLAELGVDYVQGYHVGRPAPWEDYKK